MNDPSEETSGIKERGRVSQAQKWQEDFECRLWVRSLGQGELKEWLQQQGKCWWEQIILGHIKRSWIYPNVNEGCEARVGKKLQGPVNISKSYSIQSSMNWRLKDWKLNEQLEVASGRKWWFPGPGWWFWRQSILGWYRNGEAGLGRACSALTCLSTRKFVLKLPQSQGPKYAWF